MTVRYLTYCSIDVDSMLHVEKNIRVFNPVVKDSNKLSGKIKHVTVSE